MVRLQTITFMALVRAQNDWGDQILTMELQQLAAVPLLRLLTAATLSLMCGSAATVW